MKILLVVLIFGFVLGCKESPKPVSVEQASNYEVQKLFEHDGCKVFKFYDGGYPRYFTNCTETISSITRRTGKTSTAVIETVRNEK